MTSAPVTKLVSQRSTDSPEPRLPFHLSQRDARQLPGKGTTEAQRLRRARALSAEIVEEPAATITLGRSVSPCVCGEYDLGRRGSGAGADALRSPQTRAGPTCLDPFGLKAAVPGPTLAATSKQHIPIKH